MIDINFFLSLLTVLAQVLFFVLLILFFTNSKLLTLIAKSGLEIAGVLVITAVGGSLIYSQGLGLPPCELCWWQRIFLFPQVWLLMLAVYLDDKKIADYILGLSIIGGLIAAYHYYGQMISPQILPCAIGAVSCGDKPFVGFGYITIPMMSLTVFALIILLMLIVRKKK